MCTNQKVRISCVNIHEGQYCVTLFLGIPGCYYRYPSTENKKAANTADDEPQSQRCERKRFAKEFSAFVTQDAEEAIRWMEDEEFSAWCDKILSDDSLAEDDDEGGESQTGVGDVADKISYLQLPTVLHNSELS